MLLRYRKTVLYWRAQTTNEAQLIEAGIFVGTSSIQVRASGAKPSQIRPGTSAALHELSDWPARCTLHRRLVRRCQLVTLLSIGATVSVALCNRNGFSPLLSCELLSGNWIRGGVAWRGGAFPGAIMAQFSVCGSTAVAVAAARCLQLVGFWKIPVHGLSIKMGHRCRVGGKGKPDLTVG